MLCDGGGRTWSLGGVPGRRGWAGRERRGQEGPSRDSHSGEAVGVAKQKDAVCGASGAS